MRSDSRARLESLLDSARERPLSKCDRTRRRRLVYNAALAPFFCMVLYGVCSIPTCDTLCELFIGGGVFGIYLLVVLRDYNSC